MKKIFDMWFQLQTLQTWTSTLLSFVYKVLAQLRVPMYHRNSSNFISKNNEKLLTGNVEIVIMTCLNFVYRLVDQKNIVNFFIKPNIETEKNLTSWSTSRARQIVNEFSQHNEVWHRRRWVIKLEVTASDTPAQTSHGGSRHYSNTTTALYTYVQYKISKRGVVCQVVNFAFLYLDGETLKRGRLLLSLPNHVTSSGRKKKTLLSPRIYPKEGRELRGETVGMPDSVAPG